MNKLIILLLLPIAIGAYAKKKVQDHLETDYPHDL